MATAAASATAPRLEAGLLPNPASDFLPAAPSAYALTLVVPCRAQDGSLTFWSAKRKRPLVTQKLAHGLAPWGGPCWLTALAAPAYSDVVVSGSCDGHLRFWHCDETERKLTPLLSTPLTGFVNGLALAPSGKFIAAAVGQEHRLGRWFKISEARNSVVIVPLPAPLHIKPRLGSRLQGGSRRRPGALDGDEEEAVREDDEDEEDEEDEDE